MNMGDPLIFLYAGYIVSIILLVIAGVLNPVFVIRLQLKQALVKNGLATLRKQMVGIGVIAEVVIIVALFCLTGRFFIHDPDILRYTITIAILFYSFFVLAIVIIFILIYNQNYSQRNIEIHEMIGKIEKELEAKRLANEAKLDKKKKK